MRRSSHLLPRTRGTRMIAALLALQVFGLGACGKEPTEQSPASDSPTLRTIDGKVCGYFDRDLLESLFADEPLASSGEGIRAALSDEPQGASDQCDVFGVQSNDTYVLARMSEATDAVYDPNAANRTEPGPGCETTTALDAWDGAEVCVSERNVHVSAVSTQRLVRLTVFIEDSGQVEQGKDAAIRLVQNLNENAERYHELHPD